MTDELKTLRTRDSLPNSFTTAEFREQAKANGIENEREAINWLIDHDHIKRVKTGHYEKLERYKG